MNTASVPFMSALLGLVVVGTSSVTERGGRHYAAPSTTRPGLAVNKPGRRGPFSLRQGAFPRLGFGWLGALSASRARAVSSAASARIAPATAARTFCAAH